MERKWIIILLALLTLTAQGKAKQIPEDPSFKAPLERSLSRLVRPGAGMAEALPNLVVIALVSRFFLDFAERLDLSAEQKRALERLVFEYELKLTRKSSEFRLATAELNAKLAANETDLNELERWIREKGKIRSDVEVLQLGTAPAALKILTHEQHRIVILSARRLLALEPRRLQEE